MKDIIIHAKKSLSFSKKIVKHLPPAIRKRLPKEIAIIAVSAQESLKLNRRYRHKRKPANVLSFLYDNTLLSSPRKRGSRFFSEVKGGSGFPIKSGMTEKKKDIHTYGEIIVCPAVIAEDAKKQGNTQVFQMTWMIVHGMLHLAGLHHEKSQAAKRRAIQIENAVLHIFFNTNGKLETRKLAN